MKHMVEITFIIHCISTVRYGFVIKPNGGHWTNMMYFDQKTKKTNMIRSTVKLIPIFCQKFEEIFLFPYHFSQENKIDVNVIG